MEKETGILLKICSKSTKSFCVNATRLNDEKPLLPVVGCIIAMLDEINDDTVRAAISFVISQRELTSTDIEGFCWQAKLVILQNISEKNGSKNNSYDELNAKLGALTLIDTEKICRELNIIDRAFSDDHLYGFLTRETKSLYRKMTTEISSLTKTSETKLASEYITKSKDENKHVGEILIKQWDKHFSFMKAPVYIFTLFFITLVLIGAICFFASFYLAPLLFFPVFAIVKPIIDLISSKRIKQRIPLPQVDLKGNIPSNAKTLCVISTLLTSANDVSCVIKKLDNARLKNTSDNLFFCVLCDLKANNTSETDPKDGDIIKEAQAKFKDSEYIALIRRREFSKTQRCYQGKERKRGAIESLMKLLRYDINKSGKNNPINDFAEIIGNSSALDDIKYVCALDYDTIPLMDSISELVGIALHPCHKDIGIIAPRVTTTLVSSLKTGFSRAMVGNGGCAGASSYDSFSGEFYQDTFGEGIFTGKGLINVDIFLEKCIDAFPEERVLSHDILEGGLCKTIYAGDVEFSDSFPETSNAYFKRQHRWLRGDLQNFRYIFKGKGKVFTALTRFKLFDNVRRAVTPIFVFACFFIFALPFIKNALLISAVALISIIIPFLTGFLPSVIRGRQFSNNRRFYSRTIPQTKQLILQCLMEIMLLPKNALVSLDALVRTSFRMLISKRHLLDWTTAAAFEGKKRKGGISDIMHLIPSAILSALLFYLSCIRADSLGETIFGAIMSVLFLSVLPVILIYDKTDGEPHPSIPKIVRDDLIKNAEKIWKFYEDYVTEENSFLPPDNVQYSPVYRVTRRTSPTNIGMYLISCVAARWFGFIDKNGFEKRVERTVSTIEKLKKWEGNLCNWYTINSEGEDSLKVVSPFVSSVDSGNYVCCLVALNEALKQDGCSEELITRIAKQIDQTNLKPFYNDARGLFSIGYDLDEGKLSHHHYDLLMSEARMLSYYAIASGQADKRHWRSLGRVMGKRGRYAAPVAWTGTMFEYYMPELLISSKEGSMEYEALKFCLYCQQQSAKAKGLPFGISESGFYAFDRSLNYQYKAHGVQDVALKAGLSREYVVSPYSSFIALQYDPIGCYNNLARLEKLGVCHDRYGFYEAADFTKHRVGSGYAVVKSHMAHHMGMSICAIANTLLDGVMQKMFFLNEKMKRAEELVEEKIIAGEPVLGPPERQEEKEMRMNADVFTSFSISNPRLNVLSNGQLSMITSDIGASQTLFTDDESSVSFAALFPTFDMYKPRGSLYAVIENDSIYPFYNHPSLTTAKDCEQCVVFTQNTTEYLSHSRTLKMQNDVFLDETKPVELRTFSISNKSSVKRNLTLAAYLEPALAMPRDICAHPAFMDLFIKLSYDENKKLITAIRKERDGNKEMAMAIGFVEEVDFTLSFNREETISRNGGIFSSLEKARVRGNSLVDIPAPCIFIKADITLDAHEKANKIMFICYGSSKEEVTKLAENVRLKNKCEPSEEVISPLVANTVYGRITRQVLGNILYTPQINKAAVSNNNLDIRQLWRYSISGDFPIILYEPSKMLNAVDAIVEMKKALSLCQIRVDLVMIYENEKQKRLYQELIGEINTEVFLVDKNMISSDELNLIRAAAVVTLRSEGILKTISQGVIAEKTPPSKKVQDKVIPLLKSRKPKGLAKESEGSFIIDETPDTPWCNVIANSRFGTLVSDSSLGFTWALNSRECKLTPWINDLRGDNKGELLVMKCGDNVSQGSVKLYDLIDGSRAIFSKNTADYSSVAREIEVKTSVRVYERGMGKRIVLELVNNSKTAKQVEIAYYAEPVIGVDRNSVSSRLIKTEIDGNALVFKNPSNNTLSGAMVISSDKKARFVTDKAAFWAGEWNTVSTPWEASSGDTIGAVIVRIELPPKRTEKIKFILSFTQNMTEPLTMERALKRRKSIATLPTREINSGSDELDELYKHWLPWQVIGCRMWARTGFYQNSGAYGFRDQLQDCLAAMLIKPEIAKRQIIRCCCAQFEEGDVLHWWHDLKATRKGVRTRYSDDLLWLPYVLSEYVSHTGDKDILEIKARYASALPLGDGEHERYSEIERSHLRENVYQHAKRALEKGYNKSERGLLLMGGGDWCDGYNRVGINGKGESVWLCMFYSMAAKAFAKTAMLVGDMNYAAELERRSLELNKAVDTHSWNGEYYLRAFYDDGCEMGSDSSECCKIDLLPQAFAALAELPDRNRAIKAVNNAINKLCDGENRIIKLFSPPFDRDNVKKSDPDPGYVMSYPVGVRENGGQYTHAAIWLALACHKLGMTAKAHELMMMLAPFGRGDEYRCEPYYLSADIYSNPKAYGRGGWSIYTGSASWYYKALHDMYGK